MRILVTGGAGYIGSHTVKLLGRRRHEILTYDNLSTGNDWAVLSGSLVEGDLSNLDLLRRTLKSFSPDAVIHFAGSIEVEESVKKPLLYYHNNVVNTLNLLKEIVKVKTPCFIYSSTAAVYGSPDQVPVSESAPLKPINPYGWSKMMAERVVGDVAAASGLQHLILRYFNVAGADPDGWIGQAYRRTTHLITRALKAAKGELDGLAIYGTDYPTADGTCIRDYVHVWDLAAAHLSALDYLATPFGRESRQRIMNCGYGSGFSVREVLEAVRKVTGHELPVKEMPRRPGDPACIISNPEKLMKITGWKPKFNNLELMIKTAWDWENQERPASPKPVGAVDMTTRWVANL